MSNVPLKKIVELQSVPNNIRNICILAHVDHGKTTLADALVASNGIISQKMAGKIRYLDSREDEQIRGITMKSSAISLFVPHAGQEYLVNLIDSPGHIDFSSEVSTAVRLCDGAIVVVDVAEGVCPQTHAVLRQAWLENIHPVLVLNKIDRLILELKMSPMEAYQHLVQVLEQVNAVTGELFTSDFLEKNSSKKVQTDDVKYGKNEEQLYDWSTGIEDSDDSHLYFSPDQGNVVFASAYDGWAFGITKFAQLYCQKLGLNENVLRKTLWGDYYLDTKTKRIRKNAQNKGKKPLFVQMILENLWAVYEAVMINRDKDKIEKISTSLSLKILPRDARHADPRVLLQSLCLQWLPLAQCVLGMVIEQLPSPADMVAEKAEKLLCPRCNRLDNLPMETQQLKDVFLRCESSDCVPVVVYVSKLFPVEKKHLPKFKPRPLTQEEMALRREIALQRRAQRIAQTEDKGEVENTTQAVDCQAISTVTDSEDASDTVFIAFARIFSGCIRRGQDLYVLHPRHNPARALHLDEENNKYVSPFKVSDLYLFMGRELESLDSVRAGNILGLGGLENIMIKSGTISSTLACPSFTDMPFQTAPIVRVALEPHVAGDFHKLRHGLKLLNQADPCVEVHLESTGELILTAAGEVHLEKCIDDLKQRYAKVDFTVSEPIVPFRETVITPPKIDVVGEEILCAMGKDRGGKKEKVITISTANRQCILNIRAAPLPQLVITKLESAAELLKVLDQQASTCISNGKDNGETTPLKNFVQDDIFKLKSELEVAFKEAGDVWADTLDNIWAFGPKKCGPNILVNKIPGYRRPSVWKCLDSCQSAEHQVCDYDYCIINGFQLATAAGPLCQEPMHGVCFFIEQWEHTDTSQDHVDKHDDTDSGGVQEAEVELAELSIDSEAPVAVRKKEAFGPFSGQLMSAIKEGCRRAFQAQPQRLMWAMYSCTIQTTADVLGRMYGVLNRRHGRVLSDEMREGSSMFTVDAVLPVVESFGFVEEIRKKTSGLASPQLTFNHWEVIDLDPFWEPTTEEEYMHFGEKADSENIARKYMNTLRKKKGLAVQEKLVQFAEKQRTLKKNK